MLREDNSLEDNLNRSRDVEPVEPSTMTTEQHVFEQHVITHTTQQDDGGSVVRLPTKMDPKQLESSRLTAERGLYIFERRLEQELKESVPLFLGEIQRTRSQGSSEFPRRDITFNCPPIAHSTRK